MVPYGYTSMISRSLFWRYYLKDRIFVVLALVAIMAFVLALVERRPSIEHTSAPFNLGLFFFIVNDLLALITFRREPLLSYMFLTAAILVAGTLYFFFHYLLLIQAV